jgi:hypothetical protein
MVLFRVGYVLTRESSSHLLQSLDKHMNYQRTDACLIKCVGCCHSFDPCFYLWTRGRLHKCVGPPEKITSSVIKHDGSLFLGNVQKVIIHGLMHNKLKEEKHSSGKQNINAVPQRCHCDPGCVSMLDAIRFPAVCVPRSQTRDAPSTQRHPLSPHS